ncbi:hypothetical protein LSAT2_019015 [Lamellibrachia satsuma]|nr:hypothetical protein LSAT2_019015 [Lamellibrachia satsuma]
MITDNRLRVLLTQNGCDQQRPSCFRVTPSVRQHSTADVDGFSEQPLGRAVTMASRQHLRLKEVDKKYNIKLVLNRNKGILFINSYCRCGVDTRVLVSIQVTAYMATNVGRIHLSNIAITQGNNVKIR